MVEKINLVFPDEISKETFFTALKKEARIPICLNCKKLFGLGFPNTEEGVCDHLICEENHLICECEYAKMVRNLYASKEDGLIDITPYYRVEE
jgi:hypothetical protein